MKLEAEGREFAKFLRSLESGSWKYLIHNELKKNKIKIGNKSLLGFRTGIDLTKRKSGMHFFEMQVETKKN